ncbi:MAG: hypothetical protein WC831_05250 [Parcubacteria group bacterium]|jgi:hypothetical protein
MSEEKNKSRAEINQPIADFIAELKTNLIAEEKKEEDRKEEAEKESEIEEAGESMAKVYEKVRNLIEYKDDHLIKRTAIERILKRNLIIELRQQNFSDTFLNEIVMAGYLRKESADKKLRDRIKNTVAKYQIAVKRIRNYQMKKWLTAMASCEIEEIIFPNPSRYALSRAMYQTVKERIVVKNGGKLREGDKDIQIFLAVLRSLSKLDNATLNYSLLKIYLPDWFKEDISENEIEKSAAELPQIEKALRDKLENPLSTKIGFAIRKYSVYFNIFYEAALANIGKIDKILANPESLKFTVQMSADDVYSREMKRFRKRVKRSLIFLIITKIILAVAVEYPYDAYVAGETTFLPIYINLIFPPLYLVLMSATIRRPSQENSKLIAKGAEEIVYEKKEEPIAAINLNELKNASDWAVNGFFIVTYAISFGLALWILDILHFNWVGILIFLFLFSVVSFFNALVRQPIRELLVAKEREGITGVIIDTLSLPFVRLGKWMSINFSRVNILILFFDVIVEAPFKVVVRFIQQWAGFLRKKRDELI